LVYTLDLSVQGSSATGTILRDNLPADETFIAFGQSPPGTIPTQNGSFLEWVLPSPLATGTYQITYQVKVNDFLPNGEALINNAQLTADLQSPVTAQAQVVVAGAYQVTVAVYNEAGELVKQIAILQLSEPVGNLQWPSGAALTDLEQQVSFYDLGHLIGQWDGTNDNGGEVSNGVYHIQVESVGPTGVVDNITQQVTVSRTLSRLTIEIYNEAGEVVRHLYANLSNAGSTSSFNLQLSGTILNPGASATGSASLSAITISLGNGVAVSWDGRSDSGDWVSNGVYYLQVHASEGPGNETQVRQITVEGNRPSNVFYAQPNLLKAGQTTAVLKISSTAPLTLGARIYDLAGELLKTLQGQPGANQVAWNASGISSGVYLAQLEARDTNGMLVARQILKIEVVH
jgi:flagellar hook assembly protein FlgD